MGMGDTFRSSEQVSSFLQSPNNPRQVEILAIGIKEGKDLIIGGQKITA